MHMIEHLLRIANLRKAGNIALFAAIAVFMAGCDEQKQESTIYKIGLLTNNLNGMKNVKGFKEGLSGFGYAEGKNVVFIDKNRPLRGEELVKTLDSLVRDKVDLIFTAGTPTGVAAYRATKGSDVPVVFGVMADPVRAEVMQDLSAPGGNLTGVKLSQNHALRLELFMHIAPNIKRLGVPFNPNDSAPVSAVAQLKKIAKTASIELLLVECPDNDAVTAGLSVLAEEADGIFLVPDTVVNKRIKDIVKIANARKLPLSGPSGVQMRQGGLMSFGFNHNAVGKQAARIADQILKGGNAGGIPVETARSYLGINLKTAETIGLSIPEELLRQAEEVIRAEK
jgi:putative tryptophan/tyrosine transport system substrate-binding protein